MMLRLRALLIGLLSVAVSSAAFPAAACVVAPPPPQKLADESEEAFLARIGPSEAARIAYENAAPEERMLIEQTRRWDASEMVFLARIEKIRIKGEVFPHPPSKTPKRKSVSGISPPEPAPPPLYVPISQARELYIRLIRPIKGPPSFTQGWQLVGGMNSCGEVSDGALGYLYPESEVIVFADWATQSRYDGDQRIDTKYLTVYGLNLDEAVEPRIKDAIEAQ